MQLGLRITTQDPGELLSPWVDFSGRSQQEVATVPTCSAW